MDTVTHGLLGALTSRVLFANKTRLTVTEITMVAWFAAMLPDIDYVLFWVHPLRFLTEWHRAMTHSFVMMPVWAIMIGYSIAWLRRQQYKWIAYSLVSALAITTHILSDVITIYGTQIFSPISNFRAYLGTSFFIDGYFTGIVITGLAGSIILARKGMRHQRNFAAITLFVLLCYIGLQSYYRSMAMELGEDYAKLKNLPAIKLNALPQPFSPTHWKVIIETSHQYHVAHVNIIPERWHQHYTDTMVKILTGNNEGLVNAAASYVAGDRAQWQMFAKVNHINTEVTEAWNHNDFSAFRKFAIFPVFYRQDTDAHMTCVWFTDLRYMFPEMIPPFRYGMCRTEHGSYLYRLKRNTVNERQKLRS